MSRRRIKPELPPDPNCMTCGGKGFLIRADGGAGSASFCRCRFRGTRDREPRQLSALESLEQMADRMENS